jgi:hypothetical protein
VVSDLRIKQTIEAGERNRAAMELVRNWCAHARIEKMGGIGHIEQQTGLPIGHHSMKCDHASEATMASWDFKDAALDFYDRNCVDCKLRKPVGFPNLSVLIKEREERRVAEAKKAAVLEAQATEALNARRAKRVELRQQLGPLSAAIVDHIEEFDDNRSQENYERVCESARLAPEHFSPPLIAYLFELARTEPWFMKCGLSTLHILNADPKSLVQLATLAVDRPDVTRSAAAILLAHLQEINPALLVGAIPAIVEIAYPADDPFYRHQQPRPEPELLRALWVSHRTVTTHAIDQLLSSRKHYLVELGARGLLALSDADAEATIPFARTMVSKYSRANLLIDEFDDDRHHLRYLRAAISFAFKQSPDAVDAIIQQMVHGSDALSRARALEIYRSALQDRRSEDVATSSMHRTAFRRLLWATTTETGHDVLQMIQGVFQGRPYELEGIAREEFEGLLGALLILDDRLRQHDETPRPQNEDFLQVLERGNKRSTIVALMRDLVEWASIAAKDDLAMIKKMVAMFERIPEGRDDLKGLVLGSTQHLATTVEALKLLLPQLYYGLVGPSALVRSYAAAALGELSYTARKNVPPLVFEAFSVLLWDQYVVVHKAAVHALHRFDLPEDCRHRAAQALLNLIRHYEHKSGEDRFVVECVDQLASELHHRGLAQGRTAEYLVSVLLHLEPLYVTSELRWLGRVLAQTQAFPDLLIRILPHLDDDHHRREDEAAELLAELPNAAILRKRSEFERLGKELAPQRPWLAAHIVEALTRAGAWTEARQIAQAGVEGLDPTVRNRSRRIFSRFVEIAATFEEAIAEGRSDDLPALAERWKKNQKDQEEHDTNVKERSSRTRFPSSL